MKESYQWTVPVPCPACGYKDTPDTDGSCRRCNEPIAVTDGGERTAQVAHSELPIWKRWPKGISRAAIGVCRWFLYHTQCIIYGHEWRIEFSTIPSEPRPRSALCQRCGSYKIEIEGGFPHDAVERERRRQFDE